MAPIRCAYSNSQGIPLDSGLHCCKRPTEMHWPASPSVQVLQFFAEVIDPVVMMCIQNHFYIEHHLVRRGLYEKRLSAVIAERQNIAA